MACYALDEYHSASSKSDNEMSNPFNTELLYLLPFITGAQELTGPKHGIQFVYFNKIKF